MRIKTAERKMERHPHLRQNQPMYTARSPGWPSRTHSMPYADWTVFCAWKIRQSTGRKMNRSYITEQKNKNTNPRGKYAGKTHVVWDVVCHISNQHTAEIRTKTTPNRLDSVPFPHEFYWNETDTTLNQSINQSKEWLNDQKVLMYSTIKEPENFPYGN